MKILENLRIASRALIPLFICFVLAAIGVGFVIADLDTHAVLADSDEFVQHANALMMRVQTDYEFEQRSLGSVLNNASIATRQAAIFAVEEREQLRKTGLDSDKTVKATRIVIDRAGLLLDHADKQLTGKDGALEQATASLRSLNVDLAALKPSIDRMPQLMDKTTGIAGNLDSSTADIATEIHRFVYPPPRKWYQKYVEDPLKMGLRIITISLGHL